MIGHVFRDLAIIAGVIVLLVLILVAVTGAVIESEQLSWKRREEEQRQR